MRLCLLPVIALFLPFSQSRFVIVSVGSQAPIADALTSRVSAAAFGSSSLQTLSFPLTTLVNQLKTINNELSPPAQQEPVGVVDAEPRPPGNSNSESAVATPQAYVLPEVLPRAQRPTEIIKIGGPFAKRDEKVKPEKESTAPSLVPGKVPIALLLQLYPEEDQDLDVNCCYWASQGNCASNPDWMLRNCRKSCAAHGCAGCKDDHEECPNWQKVGQCLQNANYMNYVCRYSCNQC